MLLSPQFVLLRKLIEKDSYEIRVDLNQKICEIATKASDELGENINPSECLDLLGMNPYQIQNDKRSLTIRDYIIKRMDFEKLAFYINNYWYDYRISRIIKYIMMKLFVLPIIDGNRQKNLAQSYFKLNKILGSGSYGAVYQLQTMLDKKVFPVVLKIFSVNSSMSRLETLALIYFCNGMAPHCLNFNRTLGQFHCSHSKDQVNPLKQICDSDNDTVSNPQTPHIIMDEIQGVTLKNLISFQDIFNVDDLVSIIKQVYFALKIAYHKFQFVHGDLHADNIIIVNLQTYHFLRYKYSDISNDEKNKNVTFYVKTRYHAVIIDYGFCRFNYIDPETGKMTKIDGKAGKGLLSGPDDTEDMWKFFNWIYSTYKYNKIEPPKGFKDLFLNLYFPEGLRTDQSLDDSIGMHVPGSIQDSYIENTRKLLNNAPTFIKLLDIIFKVYDRKTIIINPNLTDDAIEEKENIPVLAPKAGDFDTFIEDIFSKDPKTSEDSIENLGVFDLLKLLAYDRNEKYKDLIIKKQGELENEMAMHLYKHQQPGFAVSSSKDGKGKLVDKEKWTTSYREYDKLFKLFMIFTEKNITSTILKKFEDRIKENNRVINSEKRKYLL